MFKFVQFKLILVYQYIQKTYVNIYQKKFYKKFAMGSTTLYKFHSEWLQLNEFKGWLKQTNENGKDVAFCKICNKKLVPHKPILSRHMQTNGHKPLLRL